MRSPYGKEQKLYREIIAYASEEKRRQEQVKKELQLQVRLLEDKHRLNPNTSINIQLQKNTQRNEGQRKQRNNSHLQNKTL